MTTLLNSHGIAHKVVDGRLLAWEEASQLTDGVSVDCSKWVNITNWSRSELMVWLGY